jgi:hypothetical protein
VGLERAHPECLGQGEGLLVVGFSPHDVGGISVGLNGAQLVQGVRLVAAFLEPPGQVERLARVPPGLIVAPRQATDLAEPCEPQGMMLQRARADTFVDCLLDKRAPLREAALERRGIAQGCRDRSQIGRVTRGTTEGQALVEHPDGYSDATK